jgi:hypothetical protein
MTSTPTTIAATLDGAFAIVPMLVFHGVDNNNRAQTVQLSREIVVNFVRCMDEDIEDGETASCQITVESPDGTEIVAEIPPGEPLRNVRAAMQWWLDALDAAGPMPYTTTEN